MHVYGKPCRRCGSIERYAEWDGRPGQCVPCHRKLTNERQKAWRGRSYRTAASLTHQWTASPLDRRIPACAVCGMESIRPQAVQTLCDPSRRCPELVDGQRCSKKVGHRVNRGEYYRHIPLDPRPGLCRAHHQGQICRLNYGHDQKHEWLPQKEWREWFLSEADKWTAGLKP